MDQILHRKLINEKNNLQLQVAKAEQNIKMLEEQVMQYQQTLNEFAPLLAALGLGAGEAAVAGGAAAGAGAAGGAMGGLGSMVMRGAAMQAGANLANKLIPQREVGEDGTKPEPNKMPPMSSAERSRLRISRGDRIKEFSKPKGTPNPNPVSSPPAVLRGRPIKEDAEQLQELSLRGIGKSIGRVVQAVGAKLTGKQTPAQQKINVQKQREELSTRASRRPHQEIELDLDDHPEPEKHGQLTKDEHDFMKSLDDY